ncbi:MAG: endonuclease [Dysgonamonadaceae bacterium]|jgi:predicted extracellular nuclease|nr:endonuclease [Dysgonamonadaceae bacterium]
MKNLCAIILISFFILTNAEAQEVFRVMFYNTENFFDTKDAPDKADEEFLPDGVRHWTYGRYLNKRNNLAKVITSIGEWDYPALAGMCEVENDSVLEDLVKYSPIRKAGYRYVITESPDSRGIDVALLYQRDRFKYLSHQAYRIVFPYNPTRTTRDLLYVTGIVATGDTLDVFVCHFPSRRGGEAESEPDREFAASLLRSKCDSLRQVRTQANIVIMGDFNDEPSNRSIRETLKALPLEQNIEPQNLYNLFADFEKRRNTGSYKFGSQWNMLDQIIVSGNLLLESSRIRALPHTATIFSRKFMTVEDKANGGIRPRKTYHGFRHEGGFSDHFPVFVDFEVNTK